jgi:putative transcription antitermination factor YqgF
LWKTIVEEQVNFIVLGVPYYPDGKANAMTKKVQLFKTELLSFVNDPIRKLSYPIEIFEQDETLSTYEAEQRMKASPLYRHKVDINKIDVLSAQIILEDFLKLHPMSPIKNS